MLSVVAIPDHPRVCGELCPNGRQREHPAGSSPRVRGTRCRSAAREADRRIIPACAGNSPSDSSHMSHAADHPRVCGELGGKGRMTLSSLGSSPRVRGTLYRTMLRTPAARIIPACAGNSLASSHHRPKAPDHPRVCGELGPAVTHWPIGSGSSPRVRGTPLGRPVERWCNRIIPACAGNSSTVGVSIVAATDHPRVCGELLSTGFAEMDNAGSSPRVRGTLRHVPCLAGRDRIIPACAGNSYGAGCG